MTRTGRPRVVIDQKQFEKLCALQCTKDEVSKFFGCSEDTIERFCKRTYKTTFAAVYEQKRQPGLISLRRKQWKLADTSAAMAIFLGKNLLGQTDSPKSSSNDDSTLDKARDILDGVDSVI